MFRKLLLAFALLVGAQASLAGGSYIGRIKPLHYGSLYLDASAAEMSGRPACATRPYVVLQESQTSVGYKEKFAMILSAWLAEKPVALYGNGTCTSEGDEIIYVVTYP
ncbi:MAG: hypothetical protein K0Q43_4944 [Ramlibacter sp.]|jgi:hypothetical protein|nr:hypothetical protein [Ramlibacter sp.]